MRNYKLLLIGILISIVGLLVGQDKDTNNTIIDVIPFEITDHNNISISGILNKIDTVNLMFHTAATTVDIIETSAERLASVDWVKEYEVESWGGKSTARYSAHNTLQIGTMQWDSLSIWEDKNSGPKTDGKFGPNLFEGKVLEIDFDNGLLTIHSSLPNKIVVYEKLELIFEDDFMFIEGVSIIEGKDYSNRFLIHSGYGGTILYDDKFIKDNKIADSLKVIEESELKDSYGNVLKTKKAILPIFKLGETTLKDLPIGFFEGKISNQNMSILGGDLLKRFNVIIASDRESIYLNQNKLMSLPFIKSSN